MLSVLGLSLSYPATDKEAPIAVFSDWSMEIRSGEIIALTGANGCGKTTLLNYIAGVIPEHIEANCKGQVIFQPSLSPDSGGGAFYLSGLKLRDRFTYLSMVMSDPAVQVFFPDGVSEIAFALENSSIPAAEIESRIAKVTNLFGLEEIVRQHPATLSYGQQKLLLFAACEVLKRPLVLLDEPFSGLSQRSSELLCKWFDRMRERQCTCIFTEHKERFITLADRQICLSLPERRLNCSG
ncbi:MAG: ABC transporter ATP-binding protein [Candidatus Cloacimonetes bacterium]|nr:ABC transporter ATP-binding protein [Candidatus Cloacimonadota bacterium]